MKNIFKIIHKPKHVTAITIIIAVIIGIVGYLNINRAPTYQFAKAQAGIIQNIWTVSSSTSASGQNLTLSFQASGQIASVLVKVGDTVKNGEILATLDPQNTLGALIQAKAAYSSAVANYDKLVNGATSADIAISSTSVEMSQTTLKHNKENLILAINNSLTLATNAVNNDTNILFSNPNSNNPELISTDIVFNNQNLENKIISERMPLNKMLTSWKQELTGITADSDLSDLADHSSDNLQEIAAYMDDLNSLFTLYTFAGTNNFQTVIGVDQSNILSARASITSQINSLSSALQAVSSAETGVAQSEASLGLKISPARPEDIAAAEAQVNNANGAVQIAESAYQNRIITSPGDGVVTAVYITVGQIAAQNVPAIDLSGNTFSKNVSIMIPNNSIIDRNGTLYVLVKSGSDTEEKEITTGVSDATNTEVISGISVGDEVVIH